MSTKHEFLDKFHKQSKSLVTQVKKFNAPRELHKKIKYQRQGFRATDLYYTERQIGKKNLELCYNFYKRNLTFRNILCKINGGQKSGVIRKAKYSALSLVDIYAIVFTGIRNGVLQERFLRPISELTSTQFGKLLNLWRAGTPPHIIYSEIPHEHIIKLILASLNRRYAKVKITLEQMQLNKLELDGSTEGSVFIETKIHDDFIPDTYVTGKESATTPVGVSAPVSDTVPGIHVPVNPELRLTPNIRKTKSRISYPAVEETVLESKALNENISQIEIQTSEEEIGLISDDEKNLRLKDMFS